MIVRKGVPGIIPISRLAKGRFYLSVENPAIGMRAAKVFANPVSESPGL